MKRQCPGSSLCREAALQTQPTMQVPPQPAHLVFGPDAGYCMSLEAGQQQQYQGQPQQQQDTKEVSGQQQQQEQGQGQEDPQQQLPPAPRSEHGAFQSLPLPLQTQVLAQGGAPLNTCRASAAIGAEPRHITAWLLARSDTPLTHAARHQLWRSCEQLLVRRGEDAGPTELGHALYYAAAAGQEQVTAALLRHGAPAAAVKLQRDTTGAGPQPGWAHHPDSGVPLHPLIAAAAGGHAAVCSLLLQHTTSPVHPVTKSQAVFAAACGGHTAAVQLFLQHLVYTQYHPAAGSPLCAAARHGHEELVRLLLQQGADPQNHVGTPWSGVGGDPLQEAAGAGHIEVVRHLVSHGADPGSGLALTKAAAAGHTAVMELLLAGGADANGGGGKPLWAAARSGQLAAVKLLLKAGADPRSGRRPLHVAALRGYTDVAQVLLDHMEQQLPEAQAEKQRSEVARMLSESQELVYAL